MEMRSMLEVHFKNISSLNIFGTKSIELTRKDYYCYKTKKSSLNTQVFIAADGFIEYISDSMPYARWVDINQIKCNSTAINDLFDSRDMIAFDLGYLGSEDILEARGNLFLI
jgi:hypothetical protein